MLIASLDRSLPAPLYRQLKVALMEAIESGQWQSGERLPNEGKLAENFGGSKITVRQALQELSDFVYVRRVAEALQLRPTDPVFVLKRLRMADSEPMGIQAANIPVSLASLPAVKRVTYLTSRKPFEFVQSVMRGDGYSVILELAANRTPQAAREGGTK